MSSCRVPPWLASIVIEPYIFFMTLSIGLSSTPMDQLFQDKTCLLKFNQTVEYCLQVSESETSETKLGILASSTTLGQYKTIIETIPSVLWVLIIGSVGDRFPGTRKPFMIAIVCSNLVRHTLLLLNLVYFYEWGTTILLFSAALPTIAGSFWTGMTLAMTYVATHSNESNRVVRFLTADASLFGALAGGSLLAAQLLKHESWIGGDEIRNYSSAFILGISSSIVAIFWTVLRVEFKNIPESDSKPTTSTYGSSDNKVDETSFKGEVDTINNNKPVEDSSPKGDKPKAKDQKDEGDPMLASKKIQWKEVFNLKHVIASVQTVIRKRDTPGVRKQILLLLIAMIAIMLEKLGLSTVMFPFTQRLYKWNFEIYNYNSVIATISGPLMTMALIPFLAKVCKLADMEIAIVGVVSLMLSTLCIGSILKPIGYYLSIALGSLSNCAAISIRSKLSKLIGRHEVTQVFSAATTIEVLCPFIAAVIYTNIFNATLKDYPTLITQISTVTLFIPLIHFIIVDLKYSNREERIP